VQRFTSFNSLAAAVQVPQKLSIISQESARIRKNPQESRRRPGQPPIDGNRIKIAQNQVVGSKIFCHFTISDLYELNEMESIEYGHKITFFSIHTTETW